jgi:hypothetical protein
VYEVKTRFAPGQAVRVVPLPVDGWVWQVMVSEGPACYDCFWWFNGERKSSVLTEAELCEVKGGAPTGLKPSRCPNPPREFS